MTKDFLYVDEEIAELMGAESALGDADNPFSTWHPCGIAWRTGRAKAIAFELRLDHNRNS